MKTMLISEFKAKCISALKDVQRTREPMVVTLRGKPLAMIEPPAELQKGKSLGRLKGRMIVRCDLVKTGSAADWEMLR